MDDFNEKNGRGDAQPGDPDRRALLKCMAWAGGGVLWTVSGGVPHSRLLGEAHAATRDAAAGDFTFAQISDSHIGFAGAPNKDTPSTLREAIDRVAATKGGVAMILHTGDVSHLSKPAQFDTARQIIGQAKLDVHYIPGEHDVIEDDGRAFFEQFTPGAAKGWYSWDEGGLHFVALNNVQNLKAGGLGNLGEEQIAWLERDLAQRSASQPIVVMAHVPLWTVDEGWGWGTDDGVRALALLKRFGSVTVLNGHIHQVIQKVEGNMVFHTAASTAFPQPAPGTAPSPGPMKDVAPERLRSTLGIARISRVAGVEKLAIVHSALDAWTGGDV